MPIFQNILRKAENMVNKGIDIDSNDKHIIYEFRELFFTYGAYHEAKKEYSKTMNNYNKAMENIGNIKHLGTKNEIFGRIFYRIAYLKMMEKPKDKEKIKEILYNIEKGLNESNVDSDNYKNLEELKNKLLT